MSSWSLSTSKHFQKPLCQLSLEFLWTFPYLVPTGTRFAHEPALQHRSPKEVSLQRLRALLQQFSSNKSFEEGLVIKELQNELDDRDDGSILREMPLPEQTSFIYPSLTQDNKTRLLTLEPGSFSDELKCRLKNVDQPHEHDYEALSYFWGKEPGTITELNSGQHIYITANCEAALRRLRLENHNRLLWIDAICINQSDTAERSRQVEIMQEIYTSAKRVIIWLGEESVPDSVALKTLHQLSSRVNMGQDLRSLVRLGWYRDKRSGKILSGGADTSIIHENEYEHLVNLLSRPWFRRTWIIQEVASAKDAIVICGRQSLEWEALADVYMRLGDNFLPITQVGGEAARYSLENIFAIENTRRSRDGPLFIPLFHVLITTSSSQCQDPRDKIFAVKGLARDWADKRGLETNYEASFETLFRSFAIADANRNTNLRTLSCASGPEQSKHTKLPSWVPDWRYIDNPHPFVRYSDRTKFCASGGMKAEAWHSRDQNVLHVKGKWVDSVAMLGEKPRKFAKTAAIFEIDSKKVAEIKDSHLWLQECEELASKRDGILTAERHDELWRTVTCGLTGDGFPAPNYYSWYFKRYTKFMADAAARFTEYLEESQTLPQGIRGVTEASRSEKHGIIEASISRWSSQRRFCVTRTGALACVPKLSRYGDIICVLLGGEVPYVLRPTGAGSFWVVGECYVHGIMHGESLSGDAEVTEFRLV